jgi:serine/threonine-protein kinase
MSADLNLLFGVLALQADFLDAGQFAEACSAWAARKDTPLADLLVQRGWLSTEDRAHVEYLLQRKLKKHHGDIRASLAEVTNDPVRQSLASLADADVQQSLAALPTLASSALGSTTAYQPEGRGRYTLTRLHATGGIGQVWLARDPDLGREVALKELRPEQQEHPSAQARFLEEACITGQLEHPGIVPVHELVRSDGRPFYTMRMVRGRTLAEAIKEYHHRRQAGQAGSLELRTLLGNFVAVCNAVAYAHSRRVLHRDLKPANVVLGDFGEVVVLDWGLARLLGTNQQEEATSLLPVSLKAGSHEETVQGQVLGTPAYMAPEQADGRLDLLGPATDVHGLGAILYELLSGQPPFRGGSSDEVLRQVVRDEPVRPREHVASTPAALEAVCLKALAKKPADRYATAAELAREVEAWAADEPVRAYREPWSVRAGRLLRRHRVLAASLAAALAVTLMLGAAGGVYVQQQRQRAREQAEAALVQAAQLRDDFRFTDALAMLDQVRGWANQAADPVLQRRLGAAQADLELARDLDGVQQKAVTLVDGKWDPGRIRADFREVLARYGLDVMEGDLEELGQAIRASAVRQSIVTALDFWAQAENNLRRRERLLELGNLADEGDPWRQGVRQAVARGNGKRLLGLLRNTRQGKPTPRVVLLLAAALGEKNEEATALLRQMLQDRPRDFWLNFTLGNHLLEQQKHEEAAKSFLVATVLRPDSAAAHINLGIALKERGQPDEAIVCYHKAIALAPTNAIAHTNLGEVLRIKGKVDEAIASSRRALTLDPRLAGAHNNLGIALKTKGRVEEAIACYRKAIALDPGNAVAHTNLGAALQDRGKEDEAIACFRKAIDLAPTFAGAHHNLGHALAGKGKVEEAIGCYHKAIALEPRNARYHSSLGGILCDVKRDYDGAIACFHKAIELDPKFAQAHYNLALALKDKGKVDEAITSYKKAIALRPTFAWAHHNLGIALQGKGRLEEAIACYQKAIELDPTLAGAHISLGIALRGKGKVDEAFACFRKAIALQPRYAVAHGALGQALMQQGQYDQAQQSLRRGLALLPANHPLRDGTSQLLRQCQQLLDTDSHLKAFLAGKGAPADPAVQVQMAVLAQKPFNHLPLTAAGLYRDAFARQPHFAADHRYKAACAAALAGCGKGKDAGQIDDQQKARLRGQALEWLRADLKLWSKQLEDGIPARRAAVAAKLKHWRQDDDLAGVRDKPALAALPDEERARWGKLWAEVAALLDKASKKTP